MLSDIEYIGYTQGNIDLFVGYLDFFFPTLQTPTKARLMKKAGMQSI